jgi:hypothetical protein
MIGKTNLKHHSLDGGLHIARFNRNELQLLQYSRLEGGNHRISKSDYSEAGHRWGVRLSQFGRVLAQRPADF